MFFYFLKYKKTFIIVKFIKGDFEMDANVSFSAPQTAAVKEKTKWGLGVFYSLGEVGSQLSWYMINTYLTIFYTDIVGLPATAISTIMLIARIWDAINDPMILFFGKSDVPTAHGYFMTVLICSSLSSVELLV